MAEVAQARKGPGRVRLRQGGGLGIALLVAVVFATGLVIFSGRTAHAAVGDQAAANAWVNCLVNHGGYVTACGALPGPALNYGAWDYCVSNYPNQWCAQYPEYLSAADWNSALAKWGSTRLGRSTAPASYPTNCFDVACPTPTPTPTPTGTPAPTATPAYVDQCAQVASPARCMVIDPGEWGQIVGILHILGWGMGAVFGSIVLWASWRLMAALRGSRG